MIALIKAGIWKVLMEEKQKQAKKRKKAKIAKAGGSADADGSGSETGCDDSSPATIPRGGTAGEEEEDEEVEEEVVNIASPAAESLLQLASPGGEGMPTADAYPAGMSGGPYQPPQALAVEAFGDSPLQETPKKKKMECPPEGWEGGLTFPFWLRFGPLGKGIAMFDTVPPGKPPKAEGRTAFRAKEKEKNMNPEEDEEKEGKGEQRAVFKCFPAKQDQKAEKLQIQKKAANTHELEVYSTMMKDKVRTRQATSHEWLSQEELEEDQWGVGWFLDEVGSGRA